MWRSRPAKTTFLLITPMSNVPVQNGQLPQGFCPGDYQTLLNAFSAAQFINISLTNNIVVSATPPADHTVAWLQLDSFGRPVRTYFFAQGAWLSQHPLNPGFTMLWNQALPNFTTFDGGDANAAPFGALSGQMWQVMATTLDGLGTQVGAAQFPVGVGTFASSGAVAVGATGGEDIHKLTQPELFPHSHILHALRVQHGSVDTTVFTPSTGDSAQQPDGATQITGGDPTTGNPPTAALGHNNLPPYFGVYFLQRTNRLFYVVNA